MAIYMVGDFIREKRLRKGYTQEEVSFGICTTASLSRIENGLQMPGRYMLDKLIERLGYENSVFDMFVSKEDMELYETVQEMVRNIADDDYDELEVQIAKMEELTQNAPKLEQQYLIFAKGQLKKHRGGEAKEVMDLYMQAIHITLPEFDGKTPLHQNLLTFDEITIINNIAMQYAREENFEDALRLGFWLKEYMEEKMMDGKQKAVKYPMIVYNLSNWLGDMKRFEDVLKVTDTGIDFCIRFGILSLLPKLVFNKACALAELGDRNLAKKYFTQSVVVFETIKQEENKRTAIDWCKEHYEIVI